MSLEFPFENVITHPPLVIVEVLSPDDRVYRYNERLEDYKRMSVANIWVVDPLTRRGFDWNAGWQERTRFTVENSPVFLDLAEVYASHPQ